MIKYFYIISRVLVVLTFLAIATSIYADTLVVEKNTYNFGTIDEGENVRTRFKIKNRASYPVGIQAIVSDCGCVVTEDVIFNDNLTGKSEKKDNKSKKRTPLPRVIPPGESVEIPVVFYSTGFSGSQKKKILVKTTDIETQQIIFTVAGTVKPYITFKPSHVSINRSFSELGKQHSERFKIFKRKPNESFKVIPLRSEIKVKKIGSYGTFDEYIVYLSKGISSEREFQSYISVVNTTSIYSNKVRGLIPILVDISSDVVAKPSAQVLPVIEDMNQKIYVKVDINFKNKDFLDGARYRVSDSAMQIISTIKNDSSSATVKIGIDASKIDDEGLDGFLTVFYGDGLKTTSRIVVPMSPKIK